VPPPVTVCRFVTVAIPNARRYNRDMQAWKFLSVAALSFSLSSAMFAADVVPLVRMQSMPESKIIAKVHPMYPPDAADLRIQGVVKMTVNIDQNGKVTSVRVLSGHPLLAPAARQAVRKWVFQPTEVDGKPARVATEIDIPFDLDAYGRPVERKSAAAPQL
jgi:TonB family protein